MDTAADDILSNIFSRLPLIDLLRLKTVCKSWCSLIKSPIFISQHVHYQHHDPSVKDNHSLIIMDPYNWRDYSPYHQKGLDVLFLSGDEFEISHKLNPPHNIPDRLSEKKDFDLDWYKGICFGTIIGSCNGIICLRHAKGRHVSLWNPVIGESRLLPKSANPLPPADNIFLGFVFDSISRDYKVVRFLLEESCRRVEIYTLRTDCWRDVDFDLSYDLLYDASSMSLSDGIRHYWFGTRTIVTKYMPEPFYYNEEVEEAEHVTYESSIIWFDANKEVFGSVSLPEDYNSDGSGQHMLARINEKLAYIRWQMRWHYEAKKEQRWHLQIYVLTDFSGEKSWMKLSKINLGSECSAYPRGCVDNKILMVLVEGEISEGQFEEEWESEEDEEVEETGQEAAGEVQEEEVEEGELVEENEGESEEETEGESEEEAEGESEEETEGESEEEADGESVEESEDSVVQQQLFLVDPCSETVRFLTNLPVQGTTPSSWQAAVYKESLVSVKRIGDAGAE